MGEIEDLRRIALRLGSLGLNPKMPDDLADLCARLGSMGSHGHKPYPTHMINPDGQEAAAAIEHLNTRLAEALAKIERLERLLREVAGYLRGDPKYMSERSKQLLAKIAAALSEDGRG